MWFTVDPDVDETGRPIVRYWWRYGAGRSRSSPVGGGCTGYSGLMLLATGCTKRYSAERDGKKLGQAIFDVGDVNRQLDDLGDKFGLFTAEDRADVANNLADLAEHRVQGQPQLMNQDLTGDQAQRRPHPRGPGRDGAGRMGRRVRRTGLVHELSSAPVTQVTAGRGA
jgi:hypothetical protein